MLNINLKTNSKILNYNLINYLGNFTQLVVDIYEQFPPHTNINREDIIIIDSEDFKNIHDVELFLSIKFESEKHAPAFLVWRHMINEPMNTAITKFQNTFKGIFDEPKDFAKEYIEHNIKEIPQFVSECVDWKRVWDNTLSKQFVSIKVRDDEVVKGDVAIYNHAIFEVPIPNSKS